MFCKNCGAQLAQNSKFCASCGMKVEDEALAAAENTEISQETVDDPIAVKAPDETATQKKEKRSKILNYVFFGSFVAAALGAILFLLSTLINLIDCGDLTLYGGGDFPAVLATISLICMLMGFLVLTPLFFINLKLKFIKLLSKRVLWILSIVLIVACIGFCVFGIVDYANKQNSDSSYSGSYTGGYNNVNSSGVSKSIGLSLQVDSIKKSGSYTYVYCSVKNVSNKYVATKYRYVKVKAQFKDYSGKIVDTDWTYAVDSTWIEPGETKTFYYMVKNTNVKSASLSFTE